MRPEKDDDPRGKVVFGACRVGTVLLIANITGSASKNSSLRDQKYLKSEGEWDDCCCEGDIGVEASIFSPPMTAGIVPHSSTFAKKLMGEVTASDLNILEREELPPKRTGMISNLNCETRRAEPCDAFSCKKVFRYLDVRLFPAVGLDTCPDRMPLCEFSFIGTSNAIWISLPPGTSYCHDLTLWRVKFYGNAAPVRIEFSLPECFIEFFERAASWKMARKLTFLDLDWTG